MFSKFGTYGRSGQGLQNYYLESWHESNRIKEIEKQMSKKRTLDVANITKKTGGRKLTRGQGIPTAPIPLAMQLEAKNQAKSRRLATMNLASMGFLGIENKFYDTSLGPTALVAPTDAAGGEVDPSATSMITTPTQGDGEQQRDGKQISCKYIDIKGLISRNAIEAATAPSEGCMAYVALVLDTQTNAAQMNSEDCFKNLSGSAALAATPLRNLLFGKRFKILKSDVFDLNYSGTATSALNDFSQPGVFRTFDWYVPLDGMRINFKDGTTASVANVVDNSVHVIAYATSTNGAPGIAYNARLRFMG